jgi:hypothetical protein
MLKDNNNLSEMIDGLKLAILIDEEIKRTFPIEVNANISHYYDTGYTSVIYLEDDSDLKIICNWLKKYFGDFVEKLYPDNTVYQECTFKRNFYDTDHDICLWIVGRGSGISCKVEYEERELEAPITTEIVAKLVCK